MKRLRRRNPRPARMKPGKIYVLLQSSGAQRSATFHTSLESVEATYPYPDTSYIFEIPTRDARYVGKLKGLNA